MRTEHRSVATIQRLTVLIQSALRSDLRQKWRTKTQYPEEPIAEATRRTKMSLSSLPGLPGSGIRTDKAKARIRCREAPHGSQQDEDGCDS